MNKMLCAIPNCYRLAKGLSSLCPKHWYQVYRTGSHESSRDKSFTERFWEKVNKTDTCWVWVASKDIHGYGNFKSIEKTLKAHRVSYELCVGQIPEGMVIDHICKNKSCVNPSHLEAVTHAENSRRGNGFAKAQREKMHCANGHPFNEENTYITPAGHRSCRICRTEIMRRSRSRYAKVGTSANNGNALKTECKYGHPFDEANTMYSGKQRRCRICHNKASAEARKRAQSKTPTS